ncbi:MAG: dihydropteroate synthase, partial [Ignavibacteriaceae bacterium]|nr:dihydropteroate synthase [Ignavibacteriaceae bacterium]
NRLFTFNKPYIMGILNITPDSFSDGGKYQDYESAVEHALNMIDDGADFLDIGGESTRPGSEPISIDEEIKRTIPVIKEIKKLRPDCVISIDTTKSEVAKKALENGASIVNDISALTFDKNIASIVQKFDAGLVLMHIKGTPKNMQDSPKYDNVIREVYDFLYEQTNFAVQKGIKKIFVDPGIGFGKRVEDNFEILKRLADFKSLGFPILIGLSRKSFIGKTLVLQVDQRDVQSTILESISVLNSARIIRTHNVKLALQSTRLLENFM